MTAANLSHVFDSLCVRDAIDNETSHVLVIIGDGEMSRSSKCRCGQEDERFQHDDDDDDVDDNDDDDDDWL